MDPEIVQTLERDLETAINDLLRRLGLMRLPLLPSQRCDTGTPLTNR